MSYNIQNLKSDLTGTLHGTTLNQITGLDNLIYRAARDVLLDVDPQETKRVELLPNAIYDEVYNYSLPTDVKGNRIIDIRPTSQRQSGDNFQQRYNKEFDIGTENRGTNNFTVVFDSGLKYIRIDDKTLEEGIVLDTADDADGWTAGSNVTDVRTNNVNFVSGAGSVCFNLSAGGNPSTASIYKDLPNTLDLTDHYKQSSIFTWVYFNDASNITTCEVRWGSDASNYWSQVLSTTQEGNSFQNGWNLLRADWYTASVTGSPVVTAIDYAYLGIVYEGTAQTGVCMDNFISKMGQFMEIEYYSKFIFRDASTLAFQETVTADTNLINLDTETYNLLFNKVGEMAVQQQQGQDGARFDTPYFTGNYKNALARYRALYKSEVQAPSVTYYQQPRKGYTRFLGRKTF